MLTQQLSKAARLESFAPLLSSLKEDVQLQAVLKAHEAAIAAEFAKAGVSPGAKFVNQAAFLQQLTGASLIRAVIVRLPALGGVREAAEVRTQLTWLDACAAFNSCTGGNPKGISLEEYTRCIALCGLVKYASVDSMTPVQKVAGFVSNLAGRMDEYSSVEASFGGNSPRISASVEPGAEVA